MEKKSIIFVGIFATVLIAIGIVAACGGFGGIGGFGGFIPGNSTNSTQMKDFYNQVQNAIKNNDFNTWKSLMESQLTQDNFNKLVSNYQKMEQRINQTKEKWNIPMFPENFTYGNFTHMNIGRMRNKHGFF